MRRRWSLGALAAVIIGVLTALGVAHAGGARWELALRVSAYGVEVSATTQNLRIALEL